MRKNEYFYGTIPGETLALNLGEAAVRLRISQDYTHECIEKWEAALRKELHCKYAAVCINVLYPAENQVDLGFGPVESRSLYKNLEKSSKAFLFAVTLGHGVDRFLQKLSVTSVAGHFITDALASAFAESACDLTETEIRGTRICRPRFSPGYGDLPLSIQPQVLEALDAGRRLNITIGRNLLMSPSKSITAIMGVLE